MTSDWKECKLKDVCIQITDGVHNTVIDNPNGEYYLLSCKNIKNRNISISNQDRKIDHDTIQKLRQRTKTEKDDVLLTSVGTIGEVAIIKDENPIYEFQRSVAIFKPDKNKILPKFLLYSLDNKKRVLQYSAEGAVQQCLFINPLKEFKIELPPIETQRKIARVLGAIDDKIELNNSINKNLEQQAEALYDNLINENKDSLQEVSLSDIANITMGQSPDGSSYNENRMGTVFYQGRAEFGFRFPTRRLYTTEPKRMAYYNDILMSVRAPVGDINVAYEECCIGRGLAAIQSKNNNPSFLLYTMFNLKKDLNIFNGEGTIFGSINKDSLNSLKICIPSDAEINKFEQIVEPMDKRIEINCLENERLTQLRDTLLPKLMNGEIDVDKVEVNNI
jgi:type I restriction enzyme S subunit